MGAVWLHDTPKFLQKYNVRFQTYPGWETRSRRSGGLQQVRAVGTHHTASGAAPANQMAWMWSNSPDRPIGNIFIARDGLVTLGAAGAANTQGRGGPISTSKGMIPKDQGNLYFVAIEAANNGVGQEWPDAQMQAYIRVCAALCDQFGLKPLTDIISHWEYVLPSQPNRKIDPAGPTPSMPDIGGTTGARRWTDANFRKRVSDLMKQTQVTPAPAPAPPKPVPPFNPLNGLYGDWPTRPNKATLRRNNKGDAVRYLQGVIHHKAGGNIAVDGQFGPQTENRVKDCQRLLKLNPTGIVGKQVWTFIDMLAK
jgi:peptidoglycan hydrolase-like protein with peptidoglycan-binding domain